MTEYIYYIVGMMITGIITYILSNKYDWRQKFWLRASKSSSYKRNTLIWFVAIVVFQLLIHIIVDLFTTRAEVIDLLQGMSFGIAIIFLPLKIASKES